MNQIIYLTLFVLTITLTPGVILHMTSNVSYESNLSIIPVEQTGRVYIVGSIRLLECSGITNISSVYVNNVNITRLSILSGAVKSFNCTLVIDTSKLGLYGMIKDGDALNISLSYIYNNEIYYNKIHIIYLKNFHNNISSYDTGDNASNPNRASGDRRLQVSAYYSSDSIILDYKRHLTLFVLLALTIALLVREYDDRKRG